MRWASRIGSSDSVKRADASSASAERGGRPCLREMRVISYGKVAHWGGRGGKGRCHSLDQVSQAQRVERLLGQPRHVVLELGPGNAVLAMGIVPGGCRVAPLPTPGRGW